ncbi:MULTISPECIES: hypothetical protein [unclassified Legionella]|uniref:hypothetical protein n=1 Tax=unclassified Legionella TaxID=2622702 RepID=UPI001055334B|nr:MULTISPECIES: hypothetical protein [unclassified Legionella]MDI9817839.1 hypothetical protein [Legionella sp. PL877]
MPSYQGNKLTKYKDKQGGKNNNKVDGFYRNPKGKAFFIKKPADFKELFTELFAGLLLQAFKQCELIPKHYHNAFVCADIIQFEDGSYGLIQPNVSFTELHKLIGTSYRDGSDREPFIEMILGPSYYLLLTERENYFGLSMVLMISLLLGDYSVHSGNVVCLELSNKRITQFARIDFGAAFRHFGYEENNKDILYPLEYQGWFNPKGYTKGYFLNYKKITGLFPAIAEKARGLINELNDELLLSIMAMVLNKIPVNLIDEVTKNNLAVYLGLPSFSQVRFGTENPQQFSEDFAEIINTRLKKISELNDLLPHNSRSRLYRSLSLDNFQDLLQSAVDLSVDQTLFFPDQIEHWQYALAASESSFIDVNTLTLSQLVEQFNFFVKTLISQIESINQYQAHIRSKNSGNNFPAIPCPEADILRQYYALEADATPRLSLSLDQNCFNKDKHPHWDKTEKILTAGFNIIIIIRVLKETQNLIEIEQENHSAIGFLSTNLKQYLTSFYGDYQLFLNDLSKPTPTQDLSVDKIASSEQKTTSQHRQFSLFPGHETLSKREEFDKKKSSSEVLPPDIML